MRKSVAQAPTRKNVFFFAAVGLVVILSALVIVGFGLASRAAGGGELAYMEAEADGATISHVVVGQAGVSCGGEVFAGDAAVVDSARVEGETVDGAVSVCFRARLGNGNYVYKKYGEPKLRIWISEVFADGGGGTTDAGAVGLDIFSAGESLEYVNLFRNGAACDAAAFDSAARIISVAGSGYEYSLDLRAAGQPNSPLNPQTVVARCFRAGYGHGNYIYEKYGDSGSDVFFSGGWQGPAAAADPLPLRAAAPLAASLDYVLVEAGAACDANTFSDGDDVRTATVAGTSQREVRVEAATLEEYAGVCFRASYGGDLYQYKKYSQDNQLINFKFVWAFELSIRLSGDSLTIYSNREMASWEAVRSGPDWTTCDPSAFAEGTAADKSGTGSDRDPSSKVVDRYYVDFELERGADNGRTYCVKATDKNGNHAYGLSPLINLPFHFEARVFQVRNTLRGVVDSSDRRSFDSIQWTAVRSDRWSDFGCRASAFSYITDDDTFVLAQHYGTNYSTDSHVSFSLEGADVDGTYCVRVVATVDGLSRTAYRELVVSRLDNPHDVTIAQNGRRMVISVASDRNLGFSAVVTDGSYAASGTCEAAAFSRVDSATGETVSRLAISPQPDQSSDYGVNLDADDDGRIFCFEVTDASGATSYVTSPAANVSAAFF